jgi:hypothetical protein
MTTIWYNDIENVLLSLTDPNTWWAISNVPWVSSPKINAVTSVYNEQWWGSWIAWWSTNVNWTATDYNTVSWGSGSVYLPDWTELTISSGNTGNMSTVTYIYYDQSDSLVHTTTSAWDSVWEDKILLCVAAPTTSWKSATFQAFGTDKQSTFITADNIAANSITANEIQSNSIETRHLDAYSVTASKMDIDYLSAISADLGNIKAWDITGTTITAGSTSSNWIKLYPYSSSQWRIAFYYNWNQIWYLQWQYSSWVGSWVVMLNWNYIVLDWDTYMLGRDILDLSNGKLRIPVWTNLY